MYDENGADGKRRYTVAEIAETFHVSRKTIYRHLEGGVARQRAAAGGHQRPSTARWVAMIPGVTVAVDRPHGPPRFGRSSAVAAVPLPRSSPAPRSCPGCGRRPSSVVERRVLADELATAWLLVEGGLAGGRDRIDETLARNAFALHGGTRAAAATR